MADKVKKNQLMIFTKAPVAGEVKTRLLPFLSAEQAAALHRQLVSHCLKKLTCSNSYRCELWVSGAYEWAKAFELPIKQQRGADLGERMANAFAECFAQAAKVIVVGTDCPWLSQPHIEEALAALDDHDLVIGPATDGGYVLLGLTANCPQLFANIDWGSARVLQQTRALAESLGLDYRLLAPLDDIDRPEDLQKLQSDFPELMV